MRWALLQQHQNHGCILTDCFVSTRFQGQIQHAVLTDADNPTADDFAQARFNLPLGWVNESDVMIIRQDERSY